MDLHYLEIFNKVAEFQSYKKASEALHISQPALSVQIKKLENQINLKLFDKIGNRIYLNDNGLMVYEYTKKLFNIVNDLEDSITNSQEYIGGTLNIGGSNTPGTYILPEVIGQFKKIYPKTNFNLHIGNTTEISQLVTDGALDIAINGGSGTYNDNIYVEKLYDDSLVVVASPQNLYCYHNTIDTNDLKSMNFVVHKTDSQLYSYYQDFINKMELPENINMYLGSIDAIKNAVCANLGISLMPYVSVKFELKYGTLKRLNIQGNDQKYPYSLIYNKNKALTYTSLRFIEFLRKNIQDYFLFQE